MTHDPDYADEIGGDWPVAPAHVTHRDRTAILLLLVGLLLALGVVAAGCGNDQGMEQTAVGLRLLATSRHGDLYAVLDPKTGATVYWTIGIRGNGLAVVPAPALVPK